MIFKCISTGSKGNSYLLISDTETLVLDCGVPEKTFLNGLDYDIGKVVGTCITHEHKDHSSLADKIKGYGIDVWQPYLAEKKIDSISYGDFKIKCFDVPHNEVENRNFIIQNNGKKILYLIDLEYCKYNFKALNVETILIECNYQEELLDRDIPNLFHKVKGHMSLDTCLMTLRANVSDFTKNIILLHYGSGCDITECVKAIKNEFPEINVDYARKGETYGI